MRGPIVVSILKNASLLDSEVIATVTRVYHLSSPEDKRQILSEIHIEKQSDRARFDIAASAVGSYALEFNNVLTLVLAACSISEGANLLHARTHYKLLEKLCKD